MVGFLPEETYFFQDAGQLAETSKTGSVFSTLKWKKLDEMEKSK